MKLKQVFPDLKLNSQLGALNAKGISDDSRSVKKGDIFFVIRRKNFDIFSVLSNVESKAIVFVGDSSCSHKLESLIKHKPFIFVEDVKKEFLRNAIDSGYDLNPGSSAQVCRHGD